MVSATTVLNNILLATAALSAPSSETRLLHRDTPDPTPSFSNWAGAVYHDAPNTVTAVTGFFTVPTLIGLGNASIWVGIDGKTCATSHFKAGVNLTVSGESALNKSILAWYEWFPYVSRTFAMDLSPGDAVNLTIATTSPNTSTISIGNITKRQIGIQNVTSDVSLCQQDAEWIVSGDDTLANFDTVVFSNAYATTQTGKISPRNADIMNIARNNVPITSVDTTSHAVAIFHL